MEKNSHITSAFLNLRVLIALSFCFSGPLLALFASGVFSGSTQQPARYMPAPGQRPDTEAADLGRLEPFWNDRLTDRTGRFAPPLFRATTTHHASLPVR